MVRLSTMEDEEWKLLIRAKDVYQVFEDLWQIDYRPKGSYYNLPLRILGLWLNSKDLGLD